MINIINYVSDEYSKNDLTIPKDQECFRILAIPLFHFAREKSTYKIVIMTFDDFDYFLGRIMKTSKNNMDVF